MHPEDVAELVQDEFNQLQSAISERPELQVSDVRLLPPTGIEIEFIARQREAQLVLQGPIVPAAEVGQYQQAGIRVPILGKYQARPLVLAVGCDNWDGWPPTAELLLPEGGPLPAREWPQDPKNRGIAIGHPDYTRKFFCRPGFREFHTHPVHKNDPWDQHREGFSLAQLLIGLLDDLAHRWILGSA